MSLVNAPLTHTDPIGSAPIGSMVRAMQIGQHLIAAALTAIGVIRAIGDGVSIPAAVISGLAILAWHTAGTILPSKGGSRALIVGWLIGFAVIWIAAVSVSAEFVWVAFLLWLLAGHLLPVRWGLLFSALILAIVIVAPIVHHGTTSYANVFGPLIGGVFAFGISRGYLQLLRDAAERERLVASLTRTQQEMADLQDELALAQRHSGAIAERTRISRDIHDTIAQGISSIRLLAHAGGNRTDDADAVRTFAQVEALAGDSLGDVRRIVAALAPAELEDDALAAALQRMLDRLHDETGLQVELHVDDTLPILPTEVEVTMLRTAQSALANVRLHAQASRVVMSLIDAEDTVRLDIIDDGSGFDLAAWEQQSDTGSSSYGLRFMSARLRELGGGLDVESTPGEGTAISVHLPIHSPAPGHPSVSAESEEPS
ncbi:putative two component system histidine kinase [Microbacterium esteraromaticum]|uniref:Oxygen sensor histidine kinase NreB n=1 Tax=Microbacterium esteraromaticum TaxID=57043 RepID=A0A1R4K0I6_9MICO|nr:sensor histidine kinase [Microbacterium esteraromaticum]SJN37971.1 putative two component system histidine kinase [Microbacterium esteraromaticum]